MFEHLSRRHFFFGSLLAGTIPSGGFGSVPSLSRLGYKSPNEKLNIAGIGAGGQPFADLRLCEPENIVALADVDWQRGAAGFSRWPNAAKFKDYRQMLDKEGRNIDAVLIGTPDHTHAHCALACMQLGKHIYMEKPLSRTPWEARFLAQAAAKYKVATQMGNQGYSHDATRVACEILWSGEIGEVREVHAWTGRAGWPQGMQKIPAASAVPDTLDWDLWLGCAPHRPFTAGDADYDAFVANWRSASPFAGSPGGGPGGGAGAAGGAAGAGGGAPSRPQFGFYLPFNWRGFFDFGSGLFGDWGVHILGPANWALQLSGHLVSVECVKKEGTSPFTYPDRAVVKYEFAARGNMPPVTVYWYDNVQADPYLPPGMTAEQARKIPNEGPQVGPPPRSFAGRPQGAAPPAAGAAPGAAPPAAAQQAPRTGPPGGGARSGYNCIFVGSKGHLGTSGRGEGVGLLPGSRWAEYKLPAAYLSRSPGASTGDNHSAHVRDWIRACKGGSAACSEFSLAAPFTEWLVAGAVAVHYNGKLLWDQAKGEFTNNREANRWVKTPYRKGWALKL